MAPSVRRRPAPRLSFRPSPPHGCPSGNHLPRPRCGTEPLSAESLSGGAVRPLHFRLDVSLLRDGLSIGWQFGARSLEQLVRVAQFLEHCVYEPGTMSRTPDGVAFTLHNPPLRMGAF